MKARLCGFWVTKRMASGTTTTAVLFLLSCLGCYFLFTNSNCYDDYDWHDYSCSRYTTNLFIAGTFFLVFGATLLAVGLMMFYQIRHYNKEALLSSSADFTIHTSHPYGKQQQQQQQQKQQLFYS